MTLSPDVASDAHENARDEGSAFDAEWFRSEGRALVDALSAHLAQCMKRADDLPVLPWVPPEDAVNALPPLLGDTTVEPSTVFSQMIAGANHLHHPRFVGHQVTSPLPVAALSQLVCAFLNNSCAVFEMGPMGAIAERKVVRFFGDSIGYGAGADGVLTSGGSAGNLTALLAMRQVQGGDANLWDEGAHASSPLSVLVSEQAHYCVARAMQIMGYGARGATPVSTGPDFRMDPEALPAALEHATGQGRKVVGVVASACTTATGAFDPLEAIHEFCARRGLWMHVDGAHGASAVLSTKYKPLVAGIEKADSVVWDAHKMLLIPALTTAVLFKDGRHSYEAFAQRASYLFDGAARDEWFNGGHRTLECTKATLGVAPYVALSVHGKRFFDHYVTSRFDLARRFAAMIREAPDFELASEPQANIVCFRFCPAKRLADLDALQRAVRTRVIESGRFYLVQTALPAGLFLRTTLINPHTSESDLVDLLEDIRRGGGDGGGG